MANEMVRARLVSETGHPVPIEGVSGDGVMLFGETSAWPRRTGLRVRPISPGTKETLEKIRRERGWADDELKLKYELQGGGILLRGADPESLPHGTWEFGLNVYDVIARGNDKLEIPEGGEAKVEMRVANDVKKLEVPSDAKWDPEVRRIMKDSKLDDTDGIDWARDPSTRANRRACAFNVLAVCRELGITEAIKRLFLTEVDRIYAEVESGFGDLLDERFHDPAPPEHPIHKKLLHRLREAQMGDYDLLSFRQRRNPSLQVVTATPKGSGPHLAELDIDLGDVFDPGGFFVHLVEVVHPQRTDHLDDVRRRLEKTDAKRFLAYVAA